MTRAAQSGLPFSTPPDARLTMLDSGQGFLCGLDEQGAAHCWTTRYEEVNADKYRPPDVEFVDVSSGACVSCGLDVTGNAHCWTDNDTCYPQLPTSPPGPLHEITVATGSGICALTDENGLVCWGLEAGDPLMALAPDAGEYSKLCASFGHFCALDLDGFATCWGQYAGYGSLPNDVPFKEIACSPQATCAIDLDDHAQCWGYSLEEATATQLTQPPDMAFRSMDVYDEFACGVTLSGDIACWGNNSEGGTEVPDGFP